MKYVLYYMIAAFAIMMYFIIDATIWFANAAPVEANCKTTTEAYILLNPAFEVKNRIKLSSSDRREVFTFNRIYNAISGSIGKPPYIVDEFIYYQAIKDGFVTNTISVEGNGCHRLYFMLSVVPLDKNVKEI